ncbi:MAG: riboflavin synthase [Gaiella sp.]
MFTGIVREVGTVAAVDGNTQGIQLRIAARETASSAAIGDSIAIDGICLTAERIDDGIIVFHAVEETLSRTSLGGLRAGSEVNVEPALRAGEPLGGHFVQGHVDGVGRVRAVEAGGVGVRVVVEAPAELLRYCVEKGSIVVDGVSLTIAELSSGAFGVALVPHTLTATTLSALAPGSAVNLEVDLLAKYVERLLAPDSGSSAIAG